MNKVENQFGIIGMGRMGGNLALQALDKGFRVIGYDLHGVPELIKKSGLLPLENLADFRQLLSPPRVIFLYIPAGSPIDDEIDSLIPFLETNDLVVDGGNSYWGDSIRRYQRLRDIGLHFVDVGTSGGVEGARNGACFMVGGERAAVEVIEPILKRLAAPGGYVYAGLPGAGHFTKLVHNGIEFGMLQAIGEGIDLLEHYKEKLDIAEILKCWRNGSVIRSWLIDLMDEAYRGERNLENVSSFVEDTGEVNWLIADALCMGVPLPVISQSVMQLMASRDNNKYCARAIAMMRHKFGQHPYGQNESVARERLEGKIGGFPG